MLKASSFETLADHTNHFRTALPPPRKNATDMIFCLARIEMGKFHAREKPFLDWAHLWRDGNMKKIEEVEKGINELESAMEEKFFRYCDFLIPHQFFTMVWLRLSRPRSKIWAHANRKSSDLCTCSGLHLTFATSTSWCEDTSAWPRSNSCGLRNCIEGAGLPQRGME